mmetsp:Transcript_60875/g.127609  ORF Transcript_60875/g.127609 Transcript_60875/m.127609 type:complete len:89 (+) Transcript_60875:140-406(+)
MLGSDSDEKSPVLSPEHGQTSSKATTSLSALVRVARPKPAYRFGVRSALMSSLPPSDRAAPSIGSAEVTRIARRRAALGANEEAAPSG